MPDVALFVPCFVDQFRPGAAVAAVTVLERLGWRVHVAGGVLCCGQPPTNAGLPEAGAALTRRFVDGHRRAVPPSAPIVVLSGSCALHVQRHAGGGADRPGAEVAARTHEFTAFLHDVVGLAAVATLTPRCRARVAMHLGCHALRGLGLATPSERALPPANRLTALLALVDGLDVAPLARPDECCGFGGTFAMSEPEVSARMGQDRLRDARAAGAQALVTTDLSCTLHLTSVSPASEAPMPMWHVAELLAGTVSGTTHGA